MDLKKRRYEKEGAKAYRKANKRVQKVLKKAKEGWIDTKCKEIDACLNKNKSKKAYQLVNDLNAEKQGRSTTIQDKSRKRLTEEQEILSRWIKYCSELYINVSYGNNTVLNCSQHPEEDLQPILCEEDEVAVAAVKAGGDNIPAELVQAAGESMTDVLPKICNKIWKKKRMVNPIDSVADYSTPQKGQPTALSQLQNHKPHQSSK